MVTQRRLLPGLGLFFFFGFLIYFSYDTYIRPRTTVLIPHIIGTEPVTIDVSNAAPQILLVSALFLSTSSNDSPSDYLSWLSQFLRPITTDVYFFTTPDLEPLVRRVRGNFPITINTSFSSSFDIPPLKGLQEKYNAMHTLDREKYQISPEGYAIRNAKMYFLDEAVRYSDKKYTFAFWTDADNFRANHAYAEWPDPARIAGVWEEGHLVSSMEKEDLLFFPIRGVPHSSFQFWDEGMGPVDNEVSEGSFLGGTPKSIEWWRKVYYAYHDYYLSLELFVGNGQTLTNALFLLFPSHFITVWRDDPLAPAHQDFPLVDGSPLGNCGPERLYYQWWVASASERSRMREIFDWNARWSWAWWRTRESCRLTRVLSMQSVLERQFGAGWIVPSSSITLD